SEGGAVKGIAILGPERVPVLPNLPAAQEAGLNDFDCGAWSAVVLPLGAPDGIVRRLNKAAGEAIDTPAVRERLSAVGVTVVAPGRRRPPKLPQVNPAHVPERGR